MTPPDLTERNTLRAMAALIGGGALTSLLVLSVPQSLAGVLAWWTMIGWVVFAIQRGDPPLSRYPFYGPWIGFSGLLLWVWAKRTNP